MQTLTFVLYQIDEARRYLESGRLEQLRLALLLLDNAAEVQLQSRIREDMALEDIRERIRAHLVGFPVNDLPDILVELAEWAPLSKREKRRLEHTFDAKLTFLTTRHPVLDPRLARILSYLHRYRNEAYHQARVRRETIRTALLIHVEANLQLLETIFRVKSFASDEDYSWLAERFGDAQGFMFGSGGLRHVGDVIRAAVLPTPSSVVANLTGHLTSRVDELWDSLDFIADNSRIADRAQALRIAQEGPAAEGAVQGPELAPGSWSVSGIEALSSQILGVAAAADRLSAFEQFADIEERLEPLERQVHALEAVVDELVQDEIDRRRGK